MLVSLSCCILLKTIEGRSFSYMSGQSNSTPSRNLGSCVVIFVYLIDLLRELDETKEVNRLQQERGIGNAKHRKQVISTLTVGSY